MAAEDNTGFMSRWSRRKVAVRQGVALPEPVAAPLPASAKALPQVEPIAPPKGNPAASPSSSMQATLVDAPSVAPSPATSHPTQADTARTQPAPPPPPPLPTLAEATALTPQSDFRRFVAPGVDAGVKNAALKQLFTDPHFNVMDRLDTYIDDYGLPDPLPAGMLRQMVQSQMLGLFDHEKENAALAAPATGAAGAADATGGAGAADASEATEVDAVQPPVDASGRLNDPNASAAPSSDAAPSDPNAPAPPETSTRPHEDADLRLQPHDDAGRPSPERGTGQDPGRQR